MRDTGNEVGLVFPHTELGEPVVFSHRDTLCRWNYLPVAPQSQSSWIQRKFSKWRAHDIGKYIRIDGTTMDRPSVDQVRAVINTLYLNPSGKEKASEWLQELQRSVSMQTSTSARFSAALKALIAILLTYQHGRNDWYLCFAAMTLFGLNVDFRYPIIIVDKTWKLLVD